MKKEENKIQKIVNQDAESIARSEYIDWDKLNYKTVLIAGANGYVPQFFIHAFLKRNDMYGSEIKVIAICRDKNKARERFGEYSNRVDLDILYQDICEPLKIYDHIDYIIHAASPAGIKVTMDQPMSVFDANVMGIRNLSKIAQRDHSRIIYISSVDVYGHIEEVKRYEETDIGYVDHMASRNIYASAKRAAEALCMCYGKEGMDYVIVRPSQIMGPGVALSDERLHINMVNQILSTGKIVLKGDGTPKRSFIYVTDVITGILVAMTKGKSQEVYNVCNESSEATVRQLAEIISELVMNSTSMIEYDFVARKKDPAVTSVVSQVCISSKKLKELDWKPLVELRESSERMIKYYSDLVMNKKEKVK